MTEDNQQQSPSPSPKAESKPSKAPPTPTPPPSAYYSANFNESEPQNIAQFGSDNANSED